MEEQGGDDNYLQPVFLISDQLSCPHSWSFVYHIIVDTEKQYYIRPTALEEAPIQPLLSPAKYLCT